MSTEAMKLALEALKYHRAQTRPIHQSNEAIAALQRVLAQPQQEPVLLNGLTEAETNSTASVVGLTLNHAPCLGMDCGITRTDQIHSAECQAEHAAAIAGGKFVKPAQPQQEFVACEGEQEAPYIGHDCNPALPDAMKVFCPACCTKFRAIPAGVQKLMLDAGFEPPFTSPPARKPLTDADLGMYISKELAEYINGAYADTGCAKDQLIHFARAIEAAHGIKENT